MDDLDRITQALVDRYRVERKIGSGGMATVYLARDLKHERQVAIKVLNPDLAVAVGTERFLREIKTVANLTHPNILPLHDSGEAEGFLYFVMPFVKGESLRSRLTKEKQLPIEDAIRITREVADALDYAHRQGIVHRDIKPANIMLEEGHAVLADFGLAHAVAGAEDDRLTRKGRYLGTPAYMSPEQGTGETELDGRSDIYSLGCVLFEMLGGEPPHRGPTPFSIMMKRMREPVPDLRQLREEVPAHVQRTLEKALASSPSERFSTAGELLSDLRRAPHREGDRGDAGPGRIRPQTRSTALIGRRYRRESKTWSGLTLSRGLWLALLALVGIAGTFVVRPWIFSRTASLDMARVAVFPFLVPGEGLVMPTVGEDLATIIGHGLDGTGFLRWVDGWSLLSQREREDTRALSLRSARSYSREQACGSFLTGRLVVRGDSADVFLSLHDVNGDSLLARGSSSGTVDEVWRSGVRAAGGLLPSLTGVEVEEFGAEFLNRDLHAVAQFLMAESSVRRARYPEALFHYEAAFDLDNEFGLAAIRGAQAASWLHQGEDARRLIGEALNLPLEERDRYFAEGVLAYFEGRADDGVNSLRAALGLDPDMAVAHFQLGEIYVHLLPTSYGSDSARVALERARALDPSAVNSVFHLIEISLRRGEVEAAREAFEAFSAESSDSWVMSHLRMMMDCVDTGPGSVDWEREVLRDPHAVLTTATELYHGGAHLACSEAGYRTILAADTTTDGFNGRRWAALLSLQSLLAVQGRTDETEALILAATTSPEALRLVAGGAQLPTPEGGVPEGPCGPIVRTGEGIPGAEYFFLMDATAGLGLDGMADRVYCENQERWGEFFEETTNVQRLWFLANWQASKGNGELVEKILPQMWEGLAVSGTPRKDSLLTRAIEAEVARLGGREEQALAILLDLRPSGIGNDLLWHFAEPLGPSRVALARLLLESGQYREAHQVAEAFDGNATAYLVHVPESLEIRLAAAQALGRTAKAEEYRERLRAIRGGVR